MTLVQPYEIACIQPQAHQCPSDPRGRDEAIGKNLMRQLELLDYACAFGRGLDRSAGREGSPEEPLYLR